MPIATHFAVICYSSLKKWTHTLNSILVSASREPNLQCPPTPGCCDEFKSQTLHEGVCSVCTQGWGLDGSILPLHHLRLCLRSYLYQKLFLTVQALAKPFWIPSLYFWSKGYSREICVPPSQQAGRSLRMAVRGGELWVPIATCTGLATEQVLGNCSF